MPADNGRRNGPGADAPEAPGTLLLRLATPGSRRPAARALAHHLGAEDLVLFLRDPEVDAFLPAPGLPQTLPDGRSWQTFLARCQTAGEALGRLRTGPDPAGLAAWGLACGPDAVLVLLGGEARQGEARALLPLLQVTAMAVRSEQAARVAQAQEGFAREVTRQAEVLAASLDRARLQAESAYEEADRANRAKADFLAVVSHELRTPLNAILGYADLLEAGVAGPLTDLQHRHLGRIEAGARHLFHLIEEILSFSRVQAGEDRVDPEEVDAVELVRDAAALVEPLARARGLDFLVPAPGAPVPMRTDPGKLRQILLNLVSNAVKFTDAGAVAVELRELGEEVEISVTDSGEGIAPEHHESVFEPFRQVHAVHTRSTGGTGLGLSVSRQLARVMGGDLTLRSAPGSGSTFTLRLPRRWAAPVERARGSRRDARRGRGS